VYETLKGYTGSVASYNIWPRNEVGLFYSSQDHMRQLYLKTDMLFHAFLSVN